MAERKQCVFQLIRYVPDPVKNEFVNIGVLLHTLDDKQPLLKFTKNWGRVRCLDPDADTEMLEALEIEVGSRMKSEATDHPRAEATEHPKPEGTEHPKPEGTEHPKPILRILEQSLSNGVQITEAQAYLAESVPAGMTDLMERYVDNPSGKRIRRQTGRSALVAAMRSEFEKAGVWNMMQKHIAVSSFTNNGDPLRIDCGYINQRVKLFQAISLEANAVDAKILAFAAPDLASGVARETKKELVLTAIVEPIGWPPGDTAPDEERTAIYSFAMKIMESGGIVVKTTKDLAQLAQTAREDLHV